MGLACRRIRVSFFRCFYFVYLMVQPWVFTLLAFFSSFPTCLLHSLSRIVFFQWPWYRLHVSPSGSLVVSWIYTCFDLPIALTCITSNPHDNMYVVPSRIPSGYFFHSASEQTPHQCHSFNSRHKFVSPWTANTGNGRLLLRHRQVHLAAGLPSRHQICLTSH